MIANFFVGVWGVRYPLVALIALFILALWMDRTWSE